MMPNDHPHQLVVEGHEDKYAIIQLLSQHIAWGTKVAGYPAFVDPAGGIDKILDRDRIASRMKASGLRRIGFVVDADLNCHARWQSLRGFLVHHVPDVPSDLPPEGLVFSSQNGLRVGAWIMPNNSATGMLESLLNAMVPSAQRQLFAHANRAVEDARGHGAMFRETHLDKALLHTWLAWQDPPGLALGNAVLHSMIDGSNPNAKLFVDWFKALYIAV